MQLGNERSKATAEYKFLSSVQGSIKNVEKLINGLSELERSVDATEAMDILEEASLSQTTIGLEAARGANLEGDVLALYNRAFGTLYGISTELLKHAGICSAPEPNAVHKYLNSVKRVRGTLAYVLLESVGLYSGFGEEELGQIQSGDYHMTEGLTAFFADNGVSDSASLIKYIGQMYDLYTENPPLVSISEAEPVAWDEFLAIAEEAGLKTEIQAAESAIFEDDIHAVFANKVQLDEDFVRTITMREADEFFIGNMFPQQMAAFQKAIQPEAYGVLFQYWEKLTLEIIVSGAENGVGDEFMRFIAVQPEAKNNRDLATCAGLEAIRKKFETVGDKTHEFNS